MERQTIYELITDMFPIEFYGKHNIFHKENLPPIPNCFPVGCCYGKGAKEVHP
jgi:hypothetical protein